MHPYRFVLFSVDRKKLDTLVIQAEREISDDSIFRKARSGFLERGYRGTFYLQSMSSMEYRRIRLK